LPEYEEMIQQVGRLFREHLSNARDDGLRRLLPAV
jgi:hypothetical protein